MKNSYEYIDQSIVYDIERAKSISELERIETKYFKKNGIISNVRSKMARLGVLDLDQKMELLKRKFYFLYDAKYYYLQLGLDKSNEFVNTYYKLVPVTDKTPKMFYRMYGLYDGEWQNVPKFGVAFEEPWQVYIYLHREDLSMYSHLNVISYDVQSHSDQLYLSLDTEGLQLIRKKNK